MKNTTAAQMANALAAGGPKNFVVLSSYTNPSNLSRSEPMSYRFAVATARAIKEACGWANVDRIKASE